MFSVPLMSEEEPGSLFSSLLICEGAKGGSTWVVTLEAESVFGPLSGLGVVLGRMFDDSSACGLLGTLLATLSTLCKGRRDHPSGMVTPGGRSACPEGIVEVETGWKV